MSADLSSPCGARVRIHVHMNIFSDETIRPRDMLLILKDSLSIKDDKS